MPELTAACAVAGMREPSMRHASPHLTLVCRLSTCSADGVWSGPAPCSAEIFPAPLQLRQPVR